MNTIAEIDTRLGKEFGLTGENADLPAYKILSDARHELATLSERLIELEFGDQADAVKSDPEWPSIDAKKTKLRHRFRTLNGNVVKAAALARATRKFAVQSVGPLAKRHS